MGKICINKDLCSKCKGSCCKVSGCMYMPSDFKKMKYITIKKELLKGNINDARLAWNRTSGNIKFKMNNGIAIDETYDSSKK